MDDTKKNKAQLIDDLAKLRKTVSQLKKTTATLKEEADRWRLLIKYSRDGIVVLEPNLKVYEANQKFADLIGYSLDETYKLHCWDWDKNFAPDTIRELARSVDEKGHFFETKHTRKDGSVYDVELSNNAVSSGGKKLILCVCRDITERKHNEEIIRESQELLSTFLDNFTGIAYQVEKNAIISFSPKLFRGAVERITGYPNEEFAEGNSWNDIIHPDDVASVLDSRKWFIDIPEYVFNAEYRIIHKDGSVRWVGENAQIVRIGKTDLIHGTIFDITERKTVEEAKLKLEEQMRHSQKLEAIGTLAGGVAHDFNNVLGIILGYTDLALAELPVDSKTHDKLRHIRKASERAKDIIKQLLTFSRKVGPKKQPVNVIPVVLEVLTFLRSTLPSTIKIHHEMTLDTIMVLADPTQIHQVIMNLCVNASQAIENRNGIISVRVEKVYFESGSSEKFKNLPTGGYLKISVNDNGPGIREEIIDRIFDPYFTTRETGKGSGMGLAVVHGIVENHGGEIIVESQQDHGATFTLMIPVIKHVTNENSNQTGTTATGSESVLFIDDEDEIVTIAKMMLETQGFQVKTAVNPMIALDQFKKNPSGFDVIITDMTMPYISGDVLFKEIKKVRKDIPVILCTGHSTHIDEQRALEMGVSAYILKPISKQELTGTIRRVLDKRHPCKISVN